MGLFKSNRGQFLNLGALGLTAVLVTVFLIGIYLYFFAFQSLRENADKNGRAIGELQGNLAGLAVGSYNGITEGWHKGKEEGKEAGLSAEDTEGELRTSIRNIGRLEVLSAAVSLKNLHKTGDDYGRLEILLGDAVFAVDLSEAVITQETEQEIIISLPQPEMTLYFDENKTQKLADYQKYSFSGSAEDGFDAALNSRKAVFEEAADTITNYDSLMERAKASAAKNVALLAENVMVEDTAVKVEFMEEGERNQ